MPDIEGKEQQISSTIFGTVTDRRVKYFSKKGWFSGGAEEDLPLRHVTAVRLETSRHPVWGIILLLSGLGFFLSGEPVLIFIGVLLLLLAALLLWGSPRVVLNTAGGDLRPAVGLPWTKPEAEKFVRALRSQLFKD